MPVIITMLISCKTTLSWGQTCTQTDYIYLNDPQDYNTQGFVHKMRIGTNGILTEVSNGAGNTPWFPQGGGLGSPHGLGQDLNGNLYIGANSGTGPIAKIKCDGTLDNLNFINDAGFNIVYKDGYMFVNSSNTNRISRYSLCDGSLQGYVTLNGVPPTGDNTIVSTDWGLYIDSNGTMYATGGAGPFNSANVNNGPKSIYRFTPTDADFTNHTDYMPLMSGTDVPPGAATAGLPISNAWLWGITTDNAGNMYVVAEDPWFNHQGTTWNGVTWLLKYDPNGNLIAWTSEEQTATPKTGFKGARGILYYPKLDILYLASGVNGDCISMIKPSDLSYMGAAAGNVPGQNPKTIYIATEACPISTSVQKTICNPSVGDKVFLQTIIGSCAAPICGGTWVADPANAGMSFNACDLSFNVTGLTGCGKYTLTNVGGTCGNFTIDVNVVLTSIKAPVIAGNQTVCAGTQNPIAFTVSTPASGSGTILYQWQKSTTSCSAGFTDIAGANASTYDPPIVSQTTYYRVVASTSGACANLTGNCSSISNCVTITAQNCPCTAVAGASITKNPTGTVVAGTTVNLTASKTDAGTPTTYTWVASPSTGFTSTTSQATLTNPIAGTYNFTVTIQNNNGTGTCTATATSSLSVSTAATPCTVVTGASITKNPTGTVVAGTTINLTASKTDAGTPTTYTWVASPSTGFTSTTSQATLTNPVAGTYNFTVTIQNTSGTGTCTATATSSLSVSNAPTPCTAVAGASITKNPTGTVVAGTTVNLTASKTDAGTPTTYTWVASPSTGFTSTTQNATLTNPIAGTYNFTVTIQNTSGTGTCTATATNSLSVSTAPTPCTAVAGASITKNPTGTVVAGTTVNLTASKTDAGTPTTYTWVASPSTGFTSTTQNATLTNPIAGTYNFTVTLQNTSGTGTCTATATSSLSVSNACTMSATIAQSACNNNSTPTTVNKGDDYFNVTVSATNGTSTGNFEVLLNATVVGSGQYGTNVVVSGVSGRFKADGTTTYTLTIRDQTTTSCSITKTTTAVTSCSNSCPPQLCPIIIGIKN